MSTTLNNPQDPTHVEFERLKERTKRQAYNMAYRSTRNRADAEDVVQQAYLNAWRSFDKYDRTRPFEKWFFRILSNLFVDRSRLKKLHTISLDQPLATEDSNVLLEIPDEKNDPENRMMHQVMSDDLKEALDRTPKDFRNAVVLRDVYGFSYAEVATEMCTSIGTVRSRIHRGRKMLRMFMNGEQKKTRRKSTA